MKVLVPLALVMGLLLPLSAMADAEHPLEAGPELEATCVKDGMVPTIKVRTAKMTHTHRDGGANWLVHVVYKPGEGAMPTACEENGYYRVFNGPQVTFDSAKQPGTKIRPVPFNGGNGGLGLVSSGRINGGAEGFTNITWEHDPTWTKFNYECLPGAAKAKVYFEQKNFVVLLTHGRVNEYGEIEGSYKKVAGPKTTTNVVRVAGAC